MGCLRMTVIRPTQLHITFTTGGCFQRPYPPGGRPDKLVDLTPDDPSVNVPSRYLLWVHFLITQVYHTSGAAEQDDGEDDDEMGDFRVYEEVDHAAHSQFILAW